MLISFMSRILLPYERAAVEAHVPEPDRTQVAQLHAQVLKRVPLLDGHLTLETLHVAVGRSVAYRFHDQSPEPQAVAKYVETLHVDDLAVAAACETGDEHAWEHVIASYRPILYRAARAMTGDSATGRELADTLWAELYGIGRNRTSMASDNRRPLIAYFHGRSTLATWLRSVLAQRHVDTIRARQRDEPLDHNDVAVDSTARSARGARAQERDSPEPADPDLRRYTSAYSQALDDAVQELEPGDRLRLNSYYVQELTLAEIGRLVGEHEATVSRKLKRARMSIRRNIERKLRDEHQLTQAEIELCYQYMVDDPSIDLAGMLGP